MELPNIINYTLEKNGLIAIPKEEYERLAEPKSDRDGCPYELFREKFGMTHREYITTIPHHDQELGFGADVVVIRCSACGNVSYEQPIALASP